MPSAVNELPKGWNWCGLDDVTTRHCEQPSTGGYSLETDAETIKEGCKLSLSIMRRNSRIMNLNSTIYSPRLDLRRKPETKSLQV